MFSNWFGFEILGMTFNFGAPEVIYVFLVMMGIGIALRDENVTDALIGQAIIMVLLIWGGFFS